MLLCYMSRDGSEGDHGGSQVGCPEKNIGPLRIHEIPSVHE